MSAGTARGCLPWPDQGGRAGGAWVLPPGGPKGSGLVHFGDSGTGIFGEGLTVAVPAQGVA